ncbi:unnamed protein product [Adineta steineri]|uniref:Uncharacterized protein n=1 Tax=Adineta steineri TaxID=433720 RepID=A0A816DT84_9BILA|nr:unnamed protein product [Adineta steineri]CAF1640729.1 unnamed protein product [Adineta steineri]
MDLPRFIPLEPYQTHDIDESISPLIMDQLFEEAFKTTRFTIFTAYDNNLGDRIYIEIIRPLSSSIMLCLKKSYGYSSVQINQIHELLSIIFDFNNRIYLWGDNLNYIMGILEEYDLFVYDHILHPIDVFDVHEYFQDWYCYTFDGYPCSYPYKPFISLYEQYDLTYAIAYTFNLYLDINNDDYDNHLNQCLAITTLALVIQQQWTRKQIQQYIRAYSMLHKRCGENELSSSSSSST